MTLTTTMVGAMGLMLIMEKPKEKKIDLAAPIDLQQIWKEIRSLRFQDTGGSNKNNDKENTK